MIQKNIHCNLYSDFSQEEIRKLYYLFSRKIITLKLEQFIANTKGFDRGIGGRK